MPNTDLTGRRHGAVTVVGRDGRLPDGRVAWTAVCADGHVQRLGAAAVRPNGKGRQCQECTVKSREAMKALFIANLLCGETLTEAVKRTGIARYGYINWLGDINFVTPLRWLKGNDCRLRGQLHQNAKLSNDSVEKIRELRALGLSYGAIVNATGVGKSTVAAICTNRRR